MCEVDAKTGRARTDYRDEDHLSLYNFDGDGMVSYRDWQGDLGFDYSSRYISAGITLRFGKMELENRSKEGSDDSSSSTTSE